MDGNTAQKQRIHNPYSRENLQKEKAERRKQRTLQILMNSNQSVPTLQKDPERVRRGKKAAATRKAKQLDKQEKQQAREDSSSDRAECKAGSAQGRFQPTTLKLYDSLAGILKAATGFQEQGKHERFGSWPDSFMARAIGPSTSSDPSLFFQSTLGAGCCQGPLTAENFACRPVMFWAPELRFPEFYPAGKPCCPYHPGETSCVVHNGWSNYYRHMFDEDGITALTGREYKCSIHMDERGTTAEGKYIFYSYDAAVLCQAPAYIRAYWNENGFMRDGAKRVFSLDCGPGEAGY